MVSMCMRDQHGIEIRKLVDRNTWRRHAPQNASKRRIEVRVCKDPLPANLEE